MDYDVLVLGGGIIGCAAAYELSKYNLNIAVIEKIILFYLPFLLGLKDL